MIKVSVQNKMEIWVHSNLRPKQECVEGKAEPDFPPLTLAPTSTCEAQSQPHTETPQERFPTPQANPTLPGSHSTCPKVPHSCTSLKVTLAHCVNQSRRLSSTTASGF